MRKPKIQNRIGRSTATLPVCALLAVSLWWLPQRAYSHDYFVSLVLLALTAAVLVESANVYQLLRVRSRMVSAVWLFGAACMGFLHPYHPSAVVAFCLSVSYYLLFRTYQQVQPVVNVFHTFVMLAVGSLFWPPFIFLAPFFLWYLIVFMRSLTFRAFFAALIGLSLPFWFWTGYLLLQEDISPLRSWAGELNCLHVGTWQELTAPYVSLLDPASAPVLAFLVLTVLTLWTSVYYLLNNYDDKIRTRMMFYIFIIQSAMIVVFTVLTRQFRFSLPLLLLSESPLIAHYFTLRNTWLSLFVFTLSLVAFIGLAILTLFPDFIINFVNPLFMSE